MNCKNCGAPVHGYKCDYCGTEYPELRYSAPIVIQRTPADYQTLACKVVLDDRMLGLPGIENYVKQEMARKMSERLVEVMDIETWLDPARLQQVFGGRITVLRPHH